MWEESKEGESTDGTSVAIYCNCWGWVPCTQAFIIAFCRDLLLTFEIFHNKNILKHET